MTVWLLWEREPSTLHGIYSTKTKAERARERLRGRLRRERVGWVVGADEPFFKTRQDAYRAADECIDRYISIEGEGVR